MEWGGVGWGGVGGISSFTGGIPLDGVDFVSVTLKPHKRLGPVQLAHVDLLVCAAAGKGGVVPPVHIQRRRCIIQRYNQRQYIYLFNMYFNRGKIGIYGTGICASQYLLRTVTSHGFGAAVEQSGPLTPLGFMMPSGYPVIP